MKLKDYEVELIAKEKASSEKLEVMLVEQGECERQKKLSKEKAEALVIKQG